MLDDNTDTNKIGRDITKEEDVHVIKIKKNRRATSSKTSFAEALKVIGEQKASGPSLVILFFNKIYSTGNKLLNWLAQKDKLFTLL